MMLPVWFLAQVRSEIPRLQAIDV